MKYFFLIGLLCYWSFGLRAQSPLLDAYIQQGLQQSKILQQQNFQLQKAMYALTEAQTLFKPTVNFNTTLSAAQGGRTLEFPVGDMLNPVYTTLNTLTNSKAFPQIANVNEQLIPKDFYDVRFKATMPLINAEIKYNQAIKKELVGLQQVEIQVYKRTLVKDIKTAYFNWLKASDAIKIYDNALQILKESERVNQSLIQNGMANPTVSVRNRSEIANIEADKQAALVNRKNAAAYFNFLLNRTLDEPIQLDTTLQTNRLSATLPQGHREELDQLQHSIDLNRQILGMNQALKRPKIGASLDLGSQGRFAQIASSNKNFFAPNAFFLLGLSIDLPVYNFGRNQLKIKQAEMDLATADTQLQQVKNQLDLQMTTAQNTLLAAQEIYQAKATQVLAAERYYKDMLRRYKEGNLSFIELLDAQTQLTKSQLQQSIAQYDVWLKWVELERANAAFVLR